MDKESRDFWNKIKQFELDDSDSLLTFTDRLARENGWTYEFTIRAILEYKKFIFLICYSDQSLTPSDEVDQVWHLHLLYTRSYWDEFCEGVLNRKIHHGPTKGGKTEGNKFMNSYLQTIELYKNVFDEQPPEDIWPPGSERFKNSGFQRINLNNYWVIKKLF